MDPRDEVFALRDGMFEMAQDLLQKDRFLETVVFFVGPEEKGILSLKEPMQSAERCFAEGKEREAHAIKEGMMESVKSILKEKKAYGVVMIAEAWALTVDPGTPRTMGGDMPGMAVDVADVRKNPFRKEVIHLLWEYKYRGIRKAGFKDQVFWREKDEDGKEVIRLGNVNEMESPEHDIRGIMAQLLP